MIASRRPSSSIATLLVAVAIAGCATYSAQSTGRATPASPAASATIARYSFDYSFAGDLPLTQVFDDGVKTFVQIRPTLSLAALVIRANETGQPVQFGRNGPYLVVQGVHEGLTLRADQATAIVTNHKTLSKALQPSEATEKSRLAAQADEQQRTGKTTHDESTASVVSLVDVLRAELLELRERMQRLKDELRDRPNPAAIAPVPKPGIVFFADNSASFARTEFEAGRWRDALRPTDRLTVTGYTDATYLTPGGSRLAFARAAAVRDALVASGMPSASIRVKYFGAGRFLVNGTSEQARQQNRRVEIELSSQT